MHDLLHMTWRDVIAHDQHCTLYYVAEPRVLTLEQAS